MTNVKVDKPKIRDVTKNKDDPDNLFEREIFNKEKYKLDIFVLGIMLW